MFSVVYIVGGRGEREVGRQGGMGRGERSRGAGKDREGGEK